MLTALTLEEMQDVARIDAAQKLSEFPFDPSCLALLRDWNIHPTLIRAFECAIYDVVRVFEGGDSEPLVESIRIRSGGGYASTEAYGTASAEYLSDRYSSSTNARTFHPHSLANNPSVTAAAVLVEALISNLFSLSHFKASSPISELLIRGDVHSHLERRILAKFIDQQSQAALHANVTAGLLDNPYAVGQLLRKKDISKVGEDLIQLLGETLIDRVMTISPRHVDTLSARDKPTADRLLEISKWIAVAQLCQWCDEPIRLENSWLRERGLDLSLLDFILRNTPSGTYESFIRPIDQAIEFNATAYPAQLLTHLYNCLSTTNGGAGRFQREMGNWFEKSYIPKELQSNLSQTGWEVRKGFQVARDPLTDAGDVDLILIRGKETLFLQVKYLKRYWMPYLHDELKLIRPVLDERENKYKMGGLSKGLSQISSIKNRREMPHVIRAACTATGWSEAESSERLSTGTYLLIHNISQYDYAEWNQIYLYEWNSFRNLLHGGPNQLNLLTGEATRKKLSFKFSDPVQAARNLILSSGPAMQPMIDQAQNYRNFVAEVQFSSKANLPTIRLPLL